MQLSSHNRGKVLLNSTIHNFNTKSIVYIKTMPSVVQNITIAKKTHTFDYTCNTRVPSRLKNSTFVMLFHNSKESILTKQ